MHRYWSLILQAGRAIFNKQCDLFKLDGGKLVMGPDMEQVFFLSVEYGEGSFSTQFKHSHQHIFRFILGNQSQAL
jgi:hypothetical protein